MVKLSMLGAMLSVATLILTANGVKAENCDDLAVTIKNNSKADVNIQYQTPQRMDSKTIAKNDSITVQANNNTGGGETYVKFEAFMDTKSIAKSQIFKNYCGGAKDGKIKYTQSGPLVFTDVETLCKLYEDHGLNKYECDREKLNIPGSITVHINN